MDAIRIKYSDEFTSDEIISELIKIEEDVYLPEYQGEYESIRKRFHKFKEMFVLAYDKDELIGYLCFFPISKKLHEEIVGEEGFHDDDIDAADVCKLSDKNHIYFLSIALKKAYHGRGIGERMMEAFFDKLKAYKDKGFDILDIVASVVTDQGEDLIKKYGFVMEKDYSKSAHYKLYRKDGQEI